MLSRGYYGVKGLFNGKTMKERLSAARARGLSRADEVLAGLGARWRKGEAKKQKYFAGLPPLPPPPSALRSPLKKAPLIAPPRRYQSPAPPKRHSASGRSLGSTRRSPVGTPHPSAENRKPPVIPANLQAQLEAASQRFLAGASNSAKARAAAAIALRAGTRKSGTKKGTTPVPGTTPRGLELTAAEADIIGDAAKILGRLNELIPEIEQLKEQVEAFGLGPRVVLLSRKGTDITIEFIEKNLRKFEDLLTEVAAPGTHPEFVKSTGELRHLLEELFRLRGEITLRERAGLVGVVALHTGWYFRQIESVVGDFKTAHAFEIRGLIHQIEQLENGLHGLHVL